MDDFLEYGRGQAILASSRAADTRPWRAPAGVLGENHLQQGALHDGIGESAGGLCG